MGGGYQRTSVSTSYVCQGAWGAGVCSGTDGHCATGTGHLIYDGLTLCFR